MAANYRSVPLSVAAVLLSGLPALAAAPGCYPINDLATNKAVPRLAVIGQGPARLHFLKGGDTQPGCPGAAPACSLAAFVVPGDAVVVTSIQGRYACAAFTGGAPKFSSTGGWLPLSSLGNATPDQPADPSQWIGDWKVSSDREVRIAPARNGALHFNVTSTFAGQPIGTDGVHLPGYQAVAPSNGGATAFSVDLARGVTKNINADPNNADLCRARFWLLGPYLVSSDNGCGIPENGTATGVYRLASPQRPAAPGQTIIVQPAPPPPPPQVVVVPGAPRPTRAAAVRACSNEVVRQNNIAGTTSNNIDSIIGVSANGPNLVVEGLWSVSRNAGYQRGNFTCQWDGQFATVRLNVIAVAPPPIPQPHVTDRRPRQPEIDTPPFVDERPKPPEQPTVDTDPFVDQRPKQKNEPQQPDVDTPAFHREGNDAGDNGGGHPDLPPPRDDGGENGAGDGGGGHPDMPPPHDDSGQTGADDNGGGHPDMPVPREGGGGGDSGDGSGDSN